MNTFLNKPGLIKVLERIKNAFNDIKVILNTKADKGSGGSITVEALDASHIITFNEDGAHLRNVTIPKQRSISSFTNDSGYQTADQVETAINNKLGSVYRLKGSVAKVANLPKNAAVGDVYNVTDTGMNYVWTGTEWDALGATVDLSGLSTDMLTNGTLPVTRGGTGITSNPSMLTNLASTTAANVFQASPRPGITGILPLANGGTNTNNTSRNINTVFAGPSSGSAGNASWRKLVAADIPDLNADKITSGYISVYRFPNQIATDEDFFKTSNNCTIVNNFSRTWGPIVSIDYTFKFNDNFSWSSSTASTWQGYAPGVSEIRDYPQSRATLHVWDVNTSHHIGFAYLSINGNITVDIPVSQIPTDHTYRINGVYMRRANYR